MANADHIAQLRKGVAAWNSWREENPGISPDLSDASLIKADLRHAKLFQAKLTGANLAEADLRWANLNAAILADANLDRARLDGAHFSEANLKGASLNGAQLPQAVLDKAYVSDAKLRNANLAGANLIEAFFADANLSGANLTCAQLDGANFDRARLPKANLSGANLHRAKFSGGADLGGVKLVGAYLRAAHFVSADLSDADLSEAILEAATFIDTDLTGADLTGCRIYGVSAWNLKLDRAMQQNLIITPEDEPEIRVDDLEVAQFIYLLLNCEKIRNVINTVTRKGVLLLGRFGDGGLALLQAVAAWLRRPENGGYLPLLFDFPRPESKTYTETITTLASLARFVIVDLSGKSVPQEITATVGLYEIPFVPILEQKHKDWSMFSDFLTKKHVLKPVVSFTDQNHLLELLAKKVIAPAEKSVEKRQKLLDEVFRRASATSSS